MLGTIAPSLEHGVMIGCAGDGRFSTATRDDYVLAAAIVLARDEQAGRVYELAGDDSFTMSTQVE